MKQIKLAILSCVLLVSMLIGNVSVVSAAVGDTFTAKIDLVSPEGISSEIECTFKVLKEPQGNDKGEVQVGIGQTGNPAIDNTTSGAITIPEIVNVSGNEYTLTTLGDFAFSNCTGLTSTGLESNKTVTTIGNSAFDNCQGLTSTGLENNKTVTSVGNEAFRTCIGLVSTGLENNKTVTTIGNIAFAFCTALEKVILPKDSAITSIGETAFFGIPNLKTFFFKNKIIPNLGTNVFTTTTTIYYPEGAVNSKALEGYANAKAFKISNIKADESSLSKQYKANETFTLEGIKFKIEYEVEDTVLAELDETIRYEDEINNFKFENVILNEGENTIKYSYLGKEDSFKVNALALIPNKPAPETGDSNNRTLLVSLLVISGLGIVILGFKKKKLVK